MFICLLDIAAIVAMLFHKSITGAGRETLIREGEEQKARNNVAMLVEVCTIKRSSLSFVEATTTVPIK